MPVASVLTAKLDAMLHLTNAEVDAIHSMPMRLVALSADEVIHRMGDRPSSCVVVVEGIVSSSQPLEGDKRQIMGFSLPGDMPDLRTLHMGVIDCDVRAVSSCRVGFIDHEDLRTLCDAHPRITAALWRSTLLVASIYRQWIVNIGHRSAVNRLSHLFCELLTRLEAVGLVSNGSCHLPLTQLHLSQATGLSAVHVNRSLQELRKDGLIEFKNGRLLVPDREALARRANFRPEYLQQPRPRVAASGAC
jgi:CRP-like cAMP-binding protein